MCALAPVCSNQHPGGALAPLCSNQHLPGRCLGPSVLQPTPTRVRHTQLRERNEHAGKDLSRLHNDLASGRCGQVITELREMVTVPFPHEGQMAETFAGEFCRILEKAFTRLIIKYAGVTPHPHGAMMHRKCNIVVHLEGGRTPTSERPAHPRQLQSRSLCRARHHRDLQVASAA